MLRFTNSKFITGDASHLCLSQSLYMKMSTWYSSLLFLCVLRNLLLSKKIRANIFFFDLKKSHLKQNIFLLSKRFTHSRNAARKKVSTLRVSATAVRILNSVIFASRQFIIYEIKRVERVRSCAGERVEHMLRSYERNSWSARDYFLHLSELCATWVIEF